MQPFNTAGGSSSGGGNTRSEAERWLGIAEKLLSGRDLIGTKTFAIRARESDPRIDAADLILTVADTLIAGEKRINNQPDWYGIFQLPPLCSDMDLIANQYRHLALLLNPHKNHLPFADEAFTLISYAWSVLSDPNKKFMYDKDLNLYTRYDPAPPSGGHEIDLRFVHGPMPQQMYPQPPLFSPLEPQPQPIPSQPQPIPSQPQPILSQPQQQNVGSENLRNEARSMEEDKGNASEESEKEDSGDENSPFWTACPYCYYMFEYPGMYKDCTFRCQNCRRAFHGGQIASPPIPVNGNETQFCCWGFIPLAGSLLNSNNKTWTPFSQMISYPTDDVNRAPPGQNSGSTVHVADVNRAPPGQNSGSTVHVDDNRAPLGQDSGHRIHVDDNRAPLGQNSGPRVHFAEDNDVDPDHDIFMDDSSSDGSDADWGTTDTDSSRKRKASYAAKGKAPMKNDNHWTSQKMGDPHSKPVSGAPPPPPSIGRSITGNSFMTPATLKSNLKKNQGKVPKEWGKLDLNVEFSREEEEQPASRGIRLGGRAGAVHAEEAEEHGGIEGISFFEGLDEFLSSLPILNEDDKVKSG